MNNIFHHDHHHDPPEIQLDMHWDASLIILSYLVSVQASYTTAFILRLQRGLGMYLLASLCLSTCGIWSMHFIGMAAMSMDVVVCLVMCWWLVRSWWHLCCTHCMGMGFIPDEYSVCVQVYAPGTSLCGCEF